MSRPWTEWNGGKRPVDGKVEVRLRGGAAGVCAANVLVWMHTGNPDDIVAFRICESEAPGYQFKDGALYVDAGFVGEIPLGGPARQHVTDAAWERIRAGDRTMRECDRSGLDEYRRRQGTMLVTVEEWDELCEACKAEDELNFSLRKQLAAKDLIIRDLHEQLRASTQSVGVDSGRDGMVLGAGGPDGRRPVGALLLYTPEENKRLGRGAGVME